MKAEYLDFCTSGGIWACRKFGHGNTLLVAFHGFADDGALFEQMAQPLEYDYTIYALDLPWHGTTRWQEETFSPEDVAQLISRIEQKENRSVTALAGHSLGGRIAMAMFVRNPTAYQKLILIAPDGIRTSWLSRFERLPAWAVNQGMALIDRYPEQILSMLQKLHTVQWINTHSLKFSRRYLSNAEERNRAFQTWSSSSKFRVPPRTLHQAAKTAKNPTLLVIGGKRDPIVPIKALRAFVSNMYPFASLLEMPGKHWLVSTELGQALAEHQKNGRIQNVRDSLNQGM